MCRCLAWANDIIILDSVTGPVTRREASRFSICMSLVL